MAKTAAELLADRDKILDEYEHNIGLGPLITEGNSAELDTYMAIDRKTIEAMSGDEAAAVAFRLAQFAFHIQRSQNREDARIKWADNQLKLSIADELNNYKGYGYVEKSSQAIKHNSHASKFNEIIIYATQRSVRLNFISTGLKNMADHMKSIQFNKTRNHTNDE